MTPAAGPENKDVMAFLAMAWTGSRPPFDCMIEKRPPKPRAAKPAYLRNGNKEAFYIRNGPSSDELPVSKVIDYIAEHWK